MSIYKAILFDLDDTLVTLHEAFPAAWAAARRLCAELTGVDHARYEEASAVVRERLWGDLEAGRIKLAQLRTRQFSETLQALGIYEETLSERLHLHFGETQLATLRTFQDVAVLEQLRELVRLGIVTNGAADDHPESQASKIRHFGLAPLMEFCLISDEVGVRKPRPGIFQAALAQLGLSGDQVLFVGDSLVNDVQGANGAGLVSVWLNRSGKARDSFPAGGTPSYIITSLDDLFGILGARPMARKEEP